MNDDSRRVDPFYRDPGGPFACAKKEQYAKSRAKGAGIAASANFAGIATPTGSKWERDPNMLARIAELRQGAEDFVGVSKGYLIQQINEVAKEARAASQLKTAKECYELLYEIVNTDKDVSANVARALPPDAGVAQIRKAFLESRAAEKQLPPSTGVTVMDFDAEGEEVEAT